jgi:hypothetical protein
MAHPYDDYEAFRSGEERGERDRWRRERWDRPGERYSSEPEWRGGESWHGTGRSETWRGG